MQIAKYCLLLFLCPVTNVFSQVSVSPIHEIKIGETIPEITITNLYNYPGSSLKLSSLKGKLVILDFWSTWCASCIEAFPKLQQLQKQFDSQLQVLLVNTYKADDIKKVNSFFAKRAINTGEKMTLPFSLLQTSLMGYFPFKFVPHYVWIDKKGRLIATTSQFEVTAANIKAVIEGNAASFHMKKDALDFDYKVPLFVNGNAGTGNAFLYRSVFTNYIEGIGGISGIERTADEKISRMYLFNTDALTMLRTAYPGKLELPPNRIIIDACDSNKFQFGAAEDTLMYKNSFCYDITVFPTTLEDMLVFMQQDIYRVFHVRVKSEKRNINCMLLQQAEKLKNIYSTGGNPVINIDKRSPQNYLKNQPLNVFIDILNHHRAMKQLFVIDDTTGIPNIDIQFPAGFWEFNIQSVKAFLYDLGFNLAEDLVNMEMAVITDK